MFKKVGSQLAIAVAGGIVALALANADIAAAFNVPNNSVTSAKIVNNSVQSIDIRDGTLASVDIHDGAVARQDLAPGVLQASFAAHVSDNGTLLGGVRATSSNRSAVGQYHITFDRAMTGCLGVVNPHASNRTGFTEPPTSNVGDVWIALSSNANLIDGEFTVIFVCPPQ